MHMRRRRQPLARTIFAALRATARPVSLLVVIAMAAISLAPALAFARQQGETAPFICRVATADEAPATPAQDRHPCPCPGLCGIGGPIIISGATAIHPPTPPFEPTELAGGQPPFPIAFQTGFRPFLRGPPHT
jgi:hypothetical protein